MNAFDRIKKVLTFGKQNNLFELLNCYRRRQTSPNALGGWYNRIKPQRRIGFSLYLDKMGVLGATSRGAWVAIDRTIITGVKIKVQENGRVQRIRVDYVVVQ